MEKLKFNSIDEYLAQFSLETRSKLELLRKTIKEEAPNANEVISYGMPAFKQNGILVYFAGYKKHIGLYPHGEVIIDFKDKLKNYKTSKGAIQFSLEKELDLDLIREIVRYRMEEDLKKKK